MNNNLQLKFRPGSLKTHTWEHAELLGVGVFLLTLRRQVFASKRLTTSFLRLIFRPDKYTCPGCACKYTSSVLWSSQFVTDVHKGYRTCPLPKEAFLVLQEQCLALIREIFV